MRAGLGTDHCDEVQRWCLVFLLCAARRSMTRMGCPRLQEKSDHGLRGCQKLAHF